MLNSTIKCLSEGRVILASGSPRRQEILTNMGILPEVIPSEYDENLDRSKYTNHGDFVSDLAYCKVRAVADLIKPEDVEPILIIGADTIVTVGETIFGKPKDNTEAFEMLSRLSGKTHTVFTGVCLKTPKKEVKFWDSTDVTFGSISPEQIRNYVETGEPLDKAGGYGIQGIGGCMIERIYGGFYTVMGLPLYSLAIHLNRLFSTK